MTGKFYMIMFNNGNGWKPLEDTMFDEKEANEELKHLKSAQPDWKFRKKCVYNGPIQRLSVLH